MAVLFIRVLLIHILSSIGNELKEQIYFYSLIWCKKSVTLKKKKRPSHSFNCVHLGHTYNLQICSLSMQEKAVCEYTGLADSKDISLQKENIFPYINK